MSRVGLVRQDSTSDIRGHTSVKSVRLLRQLQTFLLISKLLRGELGLFLFSQLPFLRPSPLLLPLFVFLALLLLLPSQFFFFLEFLLLLPPQSLLAEGRQGRGEVYRLSVCTLSFKGLS